ncbi:hypothetical protein EXU85_10005 [Spirosoma sp. KCTC 42546]|uniref:hypothetical protein n=1 Tax=Spirosoma sp. KCTC 42546 TaxID=2520506 RepID=UPI00115A01EB|nr:hypothetical protein [Spirosoma sp. KCTC 42546]QDK78920.1 hypothetical protein EXU85_10005 [Spirosoma sp. KCTC 42546]
MRITTCQLPGSLLLLALITSCNRPVAYFQPNLREHSVATHTAAEPPVADPTSLEQAPVVVASLAQQPSQANSTPNRVNVLASTNKLATPKTSQLRLYKMRTLLASTSSKTGVGPNETAAPRKMTFVERLMVKKLNTTIRRQLAPNNPEKTWASKSILAIGAVLLLGGILLLAFTTGGGFALGAIAVAAGLVLLLVELL